MKPAYAYVAYPLRVVDGDTLLVKVELGFRASIETPLRLLGCNAPEKNTQAGRDAIAWTKQWLDTQGAWTRGLLIFSAHPGDYGDKYGRWLATVHAESGAVLNVDIVSTGHAVPMRL